MALAWIFGLSLGTGLGRASTNVWTDLFPHPTRSKGHKVTCSARGCRHGGPIVAHQKDGLQYRTAVRVTRVGAGYGLFIQVEATVVDGRIHGIIADIGLSGSVEKIGLGGGGWGFIGGFTLSTHTPRIRPGQRKLMKKSWPSGKKPRPVRPGERLELDVSISNVVHYFPRRSGYPKVARVSLSVPRKGKPTIVLRRPK